MNLIHSLNLTARRAAAFVIDITLLAMILAVPCAAAMIVQADYFGPGWSIALLVLVLLYFAISEYLCCGQTLGKRILRIQVRATTGAAVTAYQSVGRISLLLLLPDAEWLAENMLKWFLSVTHILPRPLSVSAPALFWTASFTIWPISLLLGRGRIAINDLIWHTEVIRVSEASKVHHSGVASWYPWGVALVTLAVSTLWVDWFILPMSIKLMEGFDKFRPTEKSEFMRLAESADDLSLRVENGPEFFPGDGRLRLWKWNPSLWKEWSVEGSCLGLPDEIREGRLQFQAYAQYIIPVTRRGFSSTGFQGIIARELLRRVMRPGLFVTVEYVHTSGVSIFRQRKTKRYLGFMYQNTAPEDSSHALVLLEPDASTVIRWEWAPFGGTFDD